MLACSRAKPGKHTFQAKRRCFCWRPVAILGILGGRTVGVKDQRVQRCCDCTMLSQAEHVLALMKFLVIQHQQSLRMHPAAIKTFLTLGTPSTTLHSYCVIYHCTYPSRALACHSITQRALQMLKPATPYHVS